MQISQAFICLPTHDLDRAYHFYLDGMGLKLADAPTDGSRPEPVIFALTSGFNLMLVPEDGFAWIAPSNTVAKAGTSECVVSVELDSSEEVDTFVKQAEAAGASPLGEPADQPWGYVGYFKDLDGHIWMATYRED